MTERDRLIEFLDGIQDFGTKITCKKDKYYGKYIEEEDFSNEQVADYLLANGVIVPPCKVGDTVYQVDNLFEEVVVTKLKVVELTIDNKGIKTLYGATSRGSIYCFDRGYNLDQIKFTKEEAKLKGGAEE